MTIGKAIFAQLTGNGPVNAMVAGRVSPNLAQQVAKAYPLIAYEGEAEDKDEEYAGASGMVTQTVRIMSAGLAYADADDLAEKVKTALHDGHGTWGGIIVQGCFFETQEETEEHDSDTGVGSVVYVIEQTYTIVFNQP